MEAPLENQTILLLDRALTHTTDHHPAVKVDHPPILATLVPEACRLPANHTLGLTGMVVPHPAEVGSVTTALPVTEDHPTPP